LRGVIKKADIILFVCLIVVGLGLSWLSVADSVTGTRVLVSVDGKPYGTYSLSQDRTVTIKQNGHTNKFTIKDGSVQMIYSDCRNQNCVEKGRINRTSQSIVCLPHRVVIEIGGGEYDAISQ
jgi:hypothetical protein